MKFTVIGSGGCVCTPKPLCQCRVCLQARKKGYPHARCGCSLYLEDASLLIDTPEDIAIAINNADIKSIDYIMYSHWDPDHTLGMRIMEQLRLEWLDYSENIKPRNPIKVLADANVMDDINKLRSKFGPFLDYYESMKLIKRGIIKKPIEINGIKISLIPVSESVAVSVFVFESMDKKLIYAPCDCKPFPNNELFQNADILVIGNTIIGDELKNGFVLSSNNPLQDELHNLEDVVNIKKQYNIEQVIITHIEEAWGKTYDDYLEIEKQYTDIRFAYDGMEIYL